ncbi:MAG: cytochrome c [Inquilinus sp.]|nr:cytochrome c [Inquilinus sp.]
MAAILVLGVGPFVAASDAFAADAGHGQDLAKQWCNSCHSIGDGEPRQEDAGPLFSDLAKRDASYLQTAINRPHDFMPKFPRLSAADKADLIAYIRSVK